MKIAKSRLKRIIKEEIQAMRENDDLDKRGTFPYVASEVSFDTDKAGTFPAVSEFDALLLDPDIPLGDKSWLRMLARVSSEKMAVSVYRQKQSEDQGDLSNL
jgi:hypothetical protein